ncbi:MAG: sensor histidine kinase, partial [Hungatella sp.]
VQLPYFILQIGPHREIIATGGNYYDLSNDAFLKDLIDETYQSPKTFGIIKEYKLRYCRFDTPSDQYIVFTDISSELATRRNLIKTCLLLGTLGFLVLLL